MKNSVRKIRRGVEELHAAGRGTGALLELAMVGREVRIIKLKEGVNEF